jgi:hypothetical protein
MKKNRLLFPILLLLAMVGCDGDDGSGELYKPFVGQWQQFACGNPDITDDHPLLKEIGLKTIADHPSFQVNGHIIEFLEDGTSPRFKHTNHYRVDSEFVYYESGNANEISLNQYRYTFIGPDTLHLERPDVGGPWPAPSYDTYKRLK